MTSVLVERLGVQVPQIVHLPPDVASLAAAEEAIELADAYGLADGHSLDESQRITLRAGLGERADGSWAASTVGDFKGRQGGGKTTTVTAREFAGLLLFGERLIIHTAHEFPTANESFLHLVSVFESWDDLRSKVLRVLYGNGTQSITLRTGQRILWKARTKGAVRGFSKAGLVVYDEAQEVQGEQVAASGPTKLANPNAQSWYAGSGGFSTSLVAWRLRRRALSGSGGRLGYTENTAEAVSLDASGRVVSVVPDPADRDGWARANPGLGRWVFEEGMESLFDELGPELFAREAECVWEPEPYTGRGWAVMPEQAWKTCRDKDHEPTGQMSHALAVALDGAWSSVGVSDGTHLEIVANREGTSWVVADCVAHNVRRVKLNPASPAGSLIAPLEKAGIQVDKVKPQEYAHACQALLNAVNDGQVRHIGQAELDRACAVAERRDSGEGWCWSQRRSHGDISPLVAITLARAAQGPKPAGYYGGDE